MEYGLIVVRFTNGSTEYAHYVINYGQGGTQYDMWFDENILDKNTVNNIVWGSKLVRQ